MPLVMKQNESSRHSTNDVAAASNARIRGPFAEFDLAIAAIQRSVQRIDPPQDRAKGVIGATWRPSPSMCKMFG